MISKIVKMLLNFETSTVANPQPWLTQLFGGRPVATGQTVNPSTAMQVSAVYACIRVLSQSVASLPLKVYEKLDNDGKRPALEHPLYPILKSTPNTEMTSFDMRELIMVHLCLRGNAYLQIIRDGASRIHSLIPLHPDRMTVMRDPGTRALVYRYQTETQGQRIMQANEVWRVNALGTDGIIGLSPIALHREAIGLAMATEEHGARMFSNGAQIASVLEHPKVLTAEGRKNIEESFANQFGGTANAFKTPVLQEGMKLNPIGMKADEAQFLQTRQFQLREIARIYGVPPSMIGDLTDASFKNSPEQQNLSFVVHSLRAWLVRIEQSIERDLMTPKERQRFFVQFDIEGFLRGDSKTRAIFYKSGIDAGWLNRNEVRKLENRNPEPGLDEFLVPLNIGRAKDPPAEPSARARAMVQSAATRVITKEIKAITKLLNGGSGFDTDSISKFYLGHKSFVMKVLAVDEDFANTHILFQMDELFKRRVPIIDILADWRDTKPQTLTNEIMSLEEADNAQQE